MLSLMLILVLIAIALTVASMAGHAPITFAVFVLCLMELLRVVPR